MEIPAGLKYTKDHEWVNVEGSQAMVGITEFAQGELGDIVFVALPKVGAQVAQKSQLCVVESTKAASDVYSPLSGTVSEVNNALKSAPETINRDPYGEGWIAKLSKVNLNELSSLLSAEEYRSYLASKS